MAKKKGKRGSPQKKTLSSSLKKAVEAKKTKEPLWKGPEVDGVTQSLVQDFLCCRERFRLKTIEGLAVPDDFNHRIEYGSMWHLCEETVALIPERARLAAGGIEKTDWKRTVFGALRKYTKLLCEKYPLQQEQIVKWYQVCLVQFPIWLKYKSQTEKRNKFKQLMAEQVFEVPYILPSGRVVKLRGKWDGIGLINRNRKPRLFLREYKTKGDVRDEQITRQLTFDLQTMFYFVALTEYEECGYLYNHLNELGVDLQSPKSRNLWIDWPLGGVDYICIRRPLAGGKHSIRQHKATKNKEAETLDEYYERLGGLIAEEPEHYFHRWVVDVSKQDIETFKTQCLNPVLEQLCDWYEQMAAVYGIGGTENPFDGLCLNHPNVHWRHPFGVYNILNEGGATEFDEYLATGSTAGLERAKTLFPELEE